MTALVLLLIVILASLWLMVHLLLNFIEAGKAVDENNFSEHLGNQLRKQKALTQQQERNKEINTVLYTRLDELEEKFPALPPGREEAEQLKAAFNRMLQSSLNLLHTAGG